MITVTFYKFNKRTNSTLRPTAAGTNFSCSLKDGCSILDPEIEIHSSVNPAEYNYAYIADFKRYYYAGDWIYFQGLWTCPLTEDVLASWKAEIGDLTKYIARSSYEWNGNIKDAFYPALANVNKSITKLASPFVSPGLNGTFILGLIGERPNANVPCVGGICYYALTYAEMADFINYLMGSTLAALMKDDAAGFSEAIVKAMVNPTDYVASCVWLPFDVTTLTAQTVQPKIGWWDTAPLASGCHPLGSGGLASLYQTVGSSVTFALPDHPQISRGAYLNAPPYSSFRLHFDPWGDIDIDANVMLSRASRNVTYTMRAELITGMAVLELWAGSVSEGLLLSRSMAQVGIPVSVAQIITELQNMSLSSVVGSVVTGAVYAASNGGNLTDAIRGALDAAESYHSKASINGVNGSLISYVGTNAPASNDYSTAGPYLETIQLSLATEDLADFGRPLLAQRKISLIPGYIECANGDHDIEAYTREKAQISAYLTGGFFYE